jgi:hypothetical protein
MMAGEKKWSQEEEDFLSLFCGDLPWPMVVQQVKRVGAIKGWPPRTTEAIKWRARVLGLSISCHGQWVRRETLAREMKTDYKQIMRLINGDRLKAKTINGAIWISRAAVRNLAQREPQAFAGLSEAELFQVLDSEKLAEELAEMKLKRPPLCRPVVCIETGWWYPSTEAAARAVYVCRTTMRQAIRTGGMANGRHWRYA